MEDYSNLEADAPQPRLCHLRKRPDFSGYGFNLHAEKGLSGHFIGKIDPDSPADAAGLREGDRIVEVNGTNIGMENHQQVVERIRAVPDETIFLVVDTETDAYYRDRKVVISSNMPNINRIDVETSFEPELEPAHSNDDSAAAAVESHYDGRLCKLQIWPDFTGYGFNLHAERGKEGQFIGKVDEGSPAEAAGLREGDRIIAVNGHDVADKSHSEVVQFIRAEVGHVDLLVVDMETNIKMESSGTSLITSSIDQIETIECPPSNPHSANGVVTAEDVDELESAAAAATAAADDDAVVVAETEPTVDAEVAAEIEPVADTVPIADAVVEDHQTNGATVEEVVPEPPPTPSDDENLYARLCHVKAWPNGAGYGFSMQAEKGRSGQYIGTVDPGSPADLAGLRFGDRIVEVNGSNIEAFSHKQVVEKIREKTDEVRLLVVDAEADQYFRSQDIKIYALMNWIKTIECPSSDPNKHAADGEHAFSEKSMDEQSLANLTIQTSVTSDDTNVADYEQVTNELTELANSQSLNDNKEVLSDSATLSTTHSTDYHHDSTSYTTTTTTPASWSATSSATSAAVQTSYETSRELTSSTTANNSVLSPLSSPSSATATANLTGQSIAEAAVAAAAKITLAPKGPVVIGGVEFAASVEEARKRVVSKRDKNKKANSMSLKDKYALYQKL